MSNSTPPQIDSTIAPKPYFKDRDNGALKVNHQQAQLPRDKKIEVLSKLLSKIN
jgi:hypothetical protein